MKKYIYNRKFFNTEVTMTGVICGIIAILSLVMIAIQVMAVLFMIVFVVAIYQVINTFYSNSNPEIVELSDTTISFSSYKRKDTYKLDEIHSFKVRQVGGEKFYIRVNKYNIQKGRYWIATKRMNDGQELAQWITEFELKVHPDSLKSQAIKSSRMYQESKKKEGNK